MRRVRMLPIRCSASLNFFFPLCRDALAGPKRLLKGWEVLASPRSADRLCHLASSSSLRHAGQPRVAVTWRSPRCWASIECYFRPSELCGVLLSDITWDRSVRNDKIFIGAIALRQTKTGANMEVLLRANHTTTLFREYLAVRILANLVPLPTGLDSSLSPPTISARSSSECLQTWVWHTCSLHRIAFATVAQPATGN
jgi:hypothetical protein